MIQIKKKVDDPRVQAMFKRSRHNNLSFFMISQDYYELRKKKQQAAMVIPFVYSNQHFQRCINTLSRQKFYEYDPQRI